MLASRPARQQRRSLRAAAVLAVALLWLPAAHGQAQDPLDNRVTDWPAAARPLLEAAEQHWFLVGFALGQLGLTDADQAGMAPEGAAAVSARRAELARAAAAAPGVRLAVLALQAERAAPLPRFAVTGQSWIDLGSRPRLALLHGVQAGVTATALLERLGAEADAMALETGFAGARRLVKPRLSLAPSLLNARLSDWLFYTDRRAAPLIESIAAIAEQIKGP